jgi:hypothetical protein
MTAWLFCVASAASSVGRQKQEMDKNDEKRAEEADRKTREERIEEKIDRNLEDSFPASDPPEWVLGVERLSQIDPD